LRFIFNERNFMKSILVLVALLVSSQAFSSDTFTKLKKLGHASSLLKETFLKSDTVRADYEEVLTNMNISLEGMLQTDIQAVTNDKSDFAGSAIYMNNSVEGRHFVKFALAKCVSNTFRTDYCNMKVVVREYSSFTEATSSDFAQSGEVLWESAFRYQFLDGALVSIFETY